MVVLVADAGKLGQPLRVFKDRIANQGRAPFHFCKSFNQIYSRAGGVQSQKDDYGHVLGRSGQAGDQVDQQAFGICPHIVQPADQKDQAVEPGFERISQGRSAAPREALPRNRNEQPQSCC